MVHDRHGRGIPPEQLSELLARLAGPDLGLRQRDGARLHPGRHLRYRLGDGDRACAAHAGPPAARRKRNDLQHRPIHSARRVLGGAADRPGGHGRLVPAGREFPAGPGRRENDVRAEPIEFPRHLGSFPDDHHRRWYCDHAAAHPRLSLAGAACGRCRVADRVQPLHLLIRTGLHGRPGAFLVRLAVFVLERLHVDGRRSCPRRRPVRGVQGSNQRDRQCDRLRRARHEPVLGHHLLRYGQPRIDHQQPALELRGHADRVWPLCQILDGGLPRHLCHHHAAAVLGLFPRVRSPISAATRASGSSRPASPTRPTRPEQAPWKFSSSSF